MGELNVGGVEAAICNLQQGNSNAAVLKETNLTKGIHMRYRAGYDVRSTQAESRHQVGVEVVWREKGMAGRGHCQLQPDVVSFLLTSIRQRWYVVGSCVPPNDAPTIGRADQAL